MSAIRLFPPFDFAQRRAGWIRRNIVTIWLAALPPLIIYAALTRQDELRDVWRALSNADPNWLLLGLGIQALITLSPVVTYKLILGRLGHTVPFYDLAGMHMQRIVVGTFTPVGGPISTYTFVRALGHRKVGAHDAVTMLMMRSVATNAAFFTLLLVVTAMRGPIYALVVSSIVVVALLVAVKLARRPAVPEWMGPFAWRRRLPRSASTRMIEFAVRFRRHQIEAADLLRPIAVTFASRLGGVIMLVVSLQAVGVDATPRMIALASMAEIAAKAAVPLFQGIGAVEVATTLALKQAGVPAEQAIGVALLWRSFEFYLPIVAALIVSGALAIWPRVPHPEPPHLPELALPRVSPAPVAVHTNGHTNGNHGD